MGGRLRQANNFIRNLWSYASFLPKAEKPMRYRNELLKAGSKGDAEKISLFISYEGHPDVRNEKGATPLMLAASSGFAEAVEALLNGKADPNAKDHMGAAALHYVGKLWPSPTDYRGCHCLNNYPGTIELLVNAGADIDLGDDAGRTPLIYSIMNHNLDMAELLLCNGANPDCPDARGSYPLKHAFNYGFDDAAVLLLNNGASQDSRDAEGTTPLMLLAKRRTAGYDYRIEKMARLLLDANACLTDYHGKTALDYAVISGNTAIAKILMEAQTT